MKRFLLIISILAAILLAVSLTSCSPSQTGNSVSTDTDDTSLSDVRIKDVSGEYWYCDSVIISENPYTNEMNGNLGTAGTLSSFAMENHGVNVMPGQTNYIVLSILGRLSETTYTVLPKIEAALVTDNSLYYNKDAIYVDNGTISSIVFESESLVADLGGGVSVNYGTSTSDIYASSFQYGYTYENSCFAAILVFPFTVAYEGELFINARAECPTLENSSNYLVESTPKRVTVGTDNENSANASVDKLSLNFISEDKYNGGSFLESDLRSTPNFDEYLSEYAVIDIEASSNDNDSELNVFAYFPDSKLLNVRVDEASTSKIDIIKSSYTTAMASYGSLFNTENSVKVRIVLELSPTKKGDCQMNVFVSGGELTKITGDTSRHVEFNVNASPFEYTLSEDKTHYTVTKLIDDTATDVIILDTYKGVPVTNVAPNLFQDNDYMKNDYLRSIVIGNNIESLPEGFLKNCTALESVSLGASIKAFPEYCFSGCKSLKSITVPKEIKKIPKYCFANCSSLESITLEGSVESIDDYAFSECTSLNSISLSSALYYIGKSAFYKCKNLTAVTFEGGTHESLQIREYAFASCQSLRAIELSLGTWHGVDSSVPSNLAGRVEINITSFEEAADFVVNQCSEKVIITNAIYEFWKN